MGKKLTEGKMEKMRARFQKLTKSLIPSIDDLMARNKEVTSWEELSEQDLMILDSQIIGAYFDNWNFEKAAKDGLISKEDAAKIKAFNEWNESLGGHDI
jgi:hypothetical protein